MKRAADKKDRKGFKGNRRNNEVARLAQRNAARRRGSRHNNEVARLAQRNAARHRGNQKAARESRKKEHHRRGHNSSDAIVVAAPEPKTPEPLVSSQSHS